MQNVILNGFNIRNDKAAVGVQFALDNNYIITLVAAQSDRTKLVNYTKCHISITKVINIDTKDVEYITKQIMDTMGYKATEEEESKGCKLLMNRDLNEFFNVLNFVRNIKKE